MKCRERRKRYQAFREARLDWAGESELTATQKCPLDGSGLKFRSRPAPHLQCRKHNHLWRIKK